MDSSNFGTSSSALALPAVALISLVIDIPPVVWHLNNRNLAATSLLFWIVICNLFNFINPLIWPTEDIQNWWLGLVFCDIEVKILLAATFGVTGSLAAIMRNLALVLDTHRTVLTRSKGQRRKKLATDCCLCLGGPVYVMIIHYVVQPNRYYLFAITGCTPSLDNSWPSIVLVFIGPPLFCLLDVYYSVLVIVRMRKYRKEFSAILSSSSSNLTKSRFMRLFLMSLTLIVVFLPVQFYVLYRNVTFPLIPYSWDNLHGPSWWDITLIPTQGSVSFDRWIQVAVGYAVFVFFGLGHDAITMYRKWFLKLGFGKLFPGLHRQHSASRVPVRSTEGHSDSLTRRAYSFYNRKSASGRPMASKKDSLSTVMSSPSPTEPEKTFLPLDAITEVEPIASSNRSYHPNPQSEQTPFPSVSVSTYNPSSWRSKMFTTTRAPASSSDEEAQSQPPADLEQRSRQHWYMNILGANRSANTTGLTPTYGSAIGNVSGLCV